MEKGLIRIYSGEGRGKSPAALGCAVSCACRGGNVVIIQFLKGKGLEESEYVRRLEPEIKIFRFEKSEVDFESLDEAHKEEEIRNIRNGINFARKVINTDGADLLILDEVLGLIDNQILTTEELRELLEAKPDEMEIIMTGIALNDEVCFMADEAIRVENVRYKVF